jgi:serine/threonine protein phosphatase 1
MNRLFAVSDIHGFLAPFQAALRQAGLVDEHHRWSATAADLAVLGDVIDRGPDSKGVVSYLLQLVSEIDAAGGELRVLLGNHEQMLIQGPHHQAAGQCWWENGGVECLASYGIDPGAQYEPAHTHAIMREHQEFFLGLDSYLVHGDTLLVHAGAPVNRKLEDLDGIVDHLWLAPRHFTRASPGYLRRQYGVERVVFGHSPMTVGGITAFQGGRFLGIDSGSFLAGGAIAVVELLPELKYRLAGCAPC